MLSCPVCGKPLQNAASAVACEDGHSFDRARSGYLNLTGGRGGRGRAGDSAAMVRARAELLARGHFEPLARAVAATSGASEVAAELGSGTGYYLARVEAEVRVAIDLSKAAAAHAAREPGLVSVVADVADRVPLADASADLLLSVFAPRPAAESARVVRPGGAFVVAMATERHLSALRDELDLIGVHPGKPEKLRERLAGAFERDAAERIEYELELAPGDVELLVAMGPNARHGTTARAAATRRDRVSVELLRFRRLDTAPPDPSK